MKLKYISHGYETCVHSHKKKGAPWKVYDSCCNPLRGPGGKGFQLPYPLVCNECCYYQKESHASSNV